MGDLLSLIEDAERKVDKKKAQKLAKKVEKGGRFDPKISAISCNR